MATGVQKNVVRSGHRWRIPISSSPERVARHGGRYGTVTLFWEAAPVLSRMPRGEEKASIAAEFSFSRDPAPRQGT